ncbi:MAG: hypothetical protein WC700_18215 [Gemmatimonadaceae bacterium]|jgi:hypothetical protein
MRTIEECNGLGRVATLASATNRVSQRLTDRLLAKPYMARKVAPAISVPELIRSTVLCERGAIGAPCQGRTQVPNVGLGGLGFSWPGSTIISNNVACVGLQDVLGAMGLALAEAKRVGASGLAVGDAQAFYDKETNWSSASNPILPSSCTAVTDAAKVRLAALNAAVGSAGGQMTAPPVSAGSGGAGGLVGDWMGTMRTVAIAAAVIAGVVVVAPIVWNAVAVSKARR